MRIDLLELAKQTDKTYLETEINRLNTMNDLGLTLRLWENFMNEMTPEYSGQFELFA